MFVTGSLNPQLHQMVHTVQSKLQISDNFACWDNLNFCISSGRKVQVLTEVLDQLQSEQIQNLVWSESAGSSYLSYVLSTGQWWSKSDLPRYFYCSWRT